MISGTTPTAENIFKKRKNSLYDKPKKIAIRKSITLSIDRTRQMVAVAHIDSARASSAAANFALTFL